MMGDAAIHASHADWAGDFKRAFHAYSAVVRAGELDTPQLSLDAIFVFFDALDFGTIAGYDLARQDSENAIGLLNFACDHIAARHGRAADAEFWRRWRDQLFIGGDEFSGPELKTLLREGSYDAAWQLSCYQPDDPEIPPALEKLRAQEGGRTTFRSKYVMHMVNRVEAA